MTMDAYGIDFGPPAAARYFISRGKMARRKRCLVLGSRARLAVIEGGSTANISLACLAVCSISRNTVSTSPSSFSAMTKVPTSQALKFKAFFLPASAHRQAVPKVLRS